MGHRGLVPITRGPFLELVSIWGQPARCQKWIFTQLLGGIFSSFSRDEISWTFQDMACLSLGKDKRLSKGGGNSNIFLIFNPNPGGMIQFDYIIFFQMGWKLKPPTSFFLLGEKTLVSGAKWLLVSGRGILVKHDISINCLEPKWPFFEVPTPKTKDRCICF